MRQSLAFPIYGHTSYQLSDVRYTLIILQMYGHAYDSGATKRDLTSVVAFVKDTVSVAFISITSGKTPCVANAANVLPLLPHHQRPGRY